MLSVEYEAEEKVVMVDKNEGKIEMVEAMMTGNNRVANQYKAQMPNTVRPVSLDSKANKDQNTHSTSNISWRPIEV